MRLPLSRVRATQPHSHHDAYPDADAESEDEQTPRPAAAAAAADHTTTTIERAVAEERYDADNRIKHRSHATPGFEHFSLELDFCRGLLEKQTRPYTRYTTRTHRQGESAAAAAAALLGAHR